MNDTPAHAKIPPFEVSDGLLYINGKSVEELAAQCEGPFYAYDAGLIASRICELRQSLPRNIKLHYAMKANPMPELVKYVAARVDGIDVASGGELDVAMSTCTDPLEISFAGPGKSVKELEQACAAGIVLNVESETELDRILDITRRLGCTANVAIRVNPDFELKGSGMRMSGGPKPFGIDAERVVEILGKLRSESTLRFMGLHIFAGSQNLNVDSICEAQQQSMALALELCTEADVTPTFLNIGGGFGIPYFRGDQPLELKPIGDNLEKIDQEMRKHFPQCSVVIELGRYIVGEAGVYVCEVTDIKYSRGHRFLITNGGLHHHLSASGNFGQVIRKNYPVLIANKIDQLPSGLASVVGPLCTPLDLLADRIELPESEVGDLVVVFQSGAYGFTASPHLFLSHSPPSEFFVLDNQQE